MIGTSLNQYRITASIGVGGMGEVFRARDARLSRDVAVKGFPWNTGAIPIGNRAESGLSHPK